jgi:hypothetical protein
MLNFKKQIGRMNGKKSELGGKNQSKLRANNHEKLGFDLSKYRGINKEKVLNNCVAPEIGLAIFNSAMNIINDNNSVQFDMFKQTF